MARQSGERRTGKHQTKAQREWHPGMKRQRRSTKIMLASSVLALESFVAFFATLVIFGLRSSEIPAAVILSAGLVLSALLVLACAVLKKPWGIGFGWLLQFALIALGFVEPMMFIIGPLFAGAWWYALFLGRRIDQENALRDAAQERWERENPVD
ncbi:DUF4233 domain-containing protein [Acaricomes phytoseiuli]|uniref:DUF4233 domain-containing protein n=1 Tax=Acaricomes phytoseiuli TaxID=291968 RepID=UPI000362434F|nr:DUF4233 domain-containing protein [Acaricomes phytoseiuli]MCW1250454.1 DUF4233 domain-containing protein [Acaricomes phytoseiuli]